MPYNGFNFEYTASMPGGTGPGSGVNEVNIQCQRLTGYDGKNTAGQQYDACREAAIIDHAKGLLKKQNGIPIKMADKPLTDSQKIDKALQLINDFGLKTDAISQQVNTANSKLASIDTSITPGASQKTDSSSMIWIVGLGIGTLFLLKKS